MQVSIIIVNYNTRQLLLDCLMSIYEKTLDVEYEIIVVDNNSSDDSVECVKNTYPNVILIRNKENNGFGMANNLGIQKSKGEYVFLLNSDTTLINNAIKIFLEFMSIPINRKFGIVGGDLYASDGSKQASYGNFPSLLEAVSELGFFRFYKSYYDKKIKGGVINTDNTNKVVDFICGADMFIRSSLIRDTGGFDEDFFLYFEETDLSLRMKKEGHLSILLPSAKIIHLEGGGATTDGFSLNKIRHFEKSRFLYHKKHGGVVKANLIKWIYVLQSVLLSVAKRDKKFLEKANIIIHS